MSKVRDIILWVIVGILIGLAFTGYVLTITSNNMCEEECEDMNALAHKMIPSGNWFSLDDTCMCIFKDKIKAFELKEVD